MTTKDDDEDQQIAEESDHLIISIPSPRGDQANVIHLPDANIGSTDTDDIPRTERHVTFSLNEQPNRNESCGKVEEEEANTLIQHISDITISGVESSPTVDDDNDTLCQEEQRLHHMLDLLHHFSEGLERIEQYATGREMNYKSEDAAAATATTTTTTTSSRVVKYHPLIINTLPIDRPQQCDLGTQTNPINDNCSGRGRSHRLNVVTLTKGQKTHSYRSSGNGNQLQQTDNSRPPCERTHHTITISTNNATSRTVHNQQRSLIARIGQTLSDFVAAFCLCLQVNKDCVFCLGFFLAFVVSASFLTAFFYRTLTLSGTAVRVRVDTLTSVSSDVAAIRFNGGYYYLYNGQKAQYV